MLLGYARNKIYNIRLWSAVRTSGKSVIGMEYLHYKISLEILLDKRYRQLLIGSLGVNTIIKTGKIQLPSFAD